MVANRLLMGGVLRSLLALRWAALALLLLASPAVADSDNESAELVEPKMEDAFADLIIEPDSSGGYNVTSPEASQFDTWQPLVDDKSSHVFCEDDLHEKDDLLVFDYFRHVGFRHSSTHGRHVGRGIPMEGSSWLNGRRGGGMKRNSGP